MFVRGALPNTIPIRYVAAQPEDNPVKTMYPQVSVNGGHLEDMMDMTPQRTNIPPQTSIGATRRSISRDTLRVSLGFDRMYAKPTQA